jgi:hypothetical protein
MQLRRSCKKESGDNCPQINGVLSVTMMPIEALLIYLQLYFPEELRTVVSRLEKLNKGMLLSIVDNIPNNVMNDLDKRWVIQLILYRKNWILNGLEGSVKI